jgi:multidrug resistance efflux pump
MRRSDQLMKIMKHNFGCMLIPILFGAGALAWGSDDVGTIRLEGCRIKPADQVTLSVNQSGILDSVPCEGDCVEAGQRVILLEDELPRASLAAAEKEAANDVDIRYADVTGMVAHSEYEQALIVNSNVKGSLSAAEIRHRKLQLEQCLLQIQQAQYKQAIAVLKRDEAAAQLKAFHVIAPFAGTVTKVLKHKGEAVRQGEPILELVNTRRVRVEGYLDVAHRRRVSPGTSVSVVPEIRAGEPVVAPVAGKILFVDTVVQPVTRQVRISADVENFDASLLPGLTAIMTISTDALPIATAKR